MVKLLSSNLQWLYIPSSKEAVLHTWVCSIVITIIVCDHVALH